ncbi:iron-containing alcohol dehydrogenase [Microbulbifer discodermiae]|uniref:iron-containing alcohol dehydrogenase n=1 Tax=Microbulbifer sp. 2201CG32-9 TaxID=3232309 RepID=UPI00345C11AD
MSIDHLRADWHYPTSMRVGPGRVRELPDLCGELHMRTPLLVTDPGLAQLPLVTQAVAQCRAAELEVDVFSAVKGNPNGRNVADGVQVLRDGGHDGVIAFGGGSAMDAGKAIALMAGQRRPLWDFEDAGENFQRVDVAGMVPVIAVPTTAGTGSEVGRAAVITDDGSQVKRIIFHPRMLPAAVILDAELTLALPPLITAATGMDALAHNLEAYCAPTYHPMAEGIALEGVRLVKEYLPIAVADGGNLTARQQMLVASAMGATAFQRGLGAMHALAHPLGALYDVHHGLLNAVLMPYVLRANGAAIAGPMERLARYIGLSETGPDTVLNWVLALREQIGIPHSLQDVGIDGEQLSRVGQMAAQDPSAATNPVHLNARQYSELCARALRGAL